MICASSTSCRLLTERLKCGGSAALQTEGSWIDNAHTLARRPEPAYLHALIVEAVESRAIHENCEILTLADVYALVPTAEERIAPTGEELARVSRVLLVTATELAFVDPYLN